MSLIRLNCLAQGNTPAIKHAFPVDIDSSKLVSQLKAAIKEKKPCFDDIAIDELKLWRVKIPINRDDKLSNLTLQDSEQLLATRIIEEYWPTTQTVPMEEYIHIIIGRYETKKQEQELLDQLSSSKVHQEFKIKVYGKIYRYF